MSARRRTLFDPITAAGPRSGPDLRSDGGKNSQPGPLSVSACVKLIKNVLTEAFTTNIMVVGEISNISIPASGHMYFSLKDTDSTISAVMWKSASKRLKFKPANGMEVVIEGKPDIYDAQGKLQLYVERMTPRGAGALELGFRQLQEKLQAEGLFDTTRKKPIPRFPQAVGIITSPTGAAIRDIQRTLHQRFPGVKAYLLPVTVQGEGASAEISEALELLDANTKKFQIDTIIIARGGGSLEDLWGFNEEILARTIAAAHTPIISGVGHEVDMTICDMVADFRAATPTAAAEYAVPDRLDLARYITNLSVRLEQNIRDSLNRWKIELRGISRSSIFRAPTTHLRTSAQRIDELSHRLGSSLQVQVANSRRKLEPLSPRLVVLAPERLCERANAKLDSIASRLRWRLGECSKKNGDRLVNLKSALKEVNPSHRLKLARQQIDAAEKHLIAMSYRSVLQRGFTVTRDINGSIIRSSQNIKTRDTIETEFADG
ncbi:MAG: exodeoxyribonuclease VII large subunit, partial [Deltaproteobacteria bacterium]|nr:exodeoxyribonuclease VII large subunit [Deltaproteobacteria bacterium]